MNPLVEEIHTELELMKEELSTFKSLVAYLDSAKQVVASSVKQLHTTDDDYIKRVESLNQVYKELESLVDHYNSFLTKIDAVNFPEQFDAVQASFISLKDNLNTFSETSLQELKKVSNTIVNSKIDERFNNFEDANNKSADDRAAFKREILTKVEWLQGNQEREISKAIDRIKLLQTDIKGLNFSIRIDKLDASVAGVLSSIQNIQSNIDKSEKHVSEKITENLTKQSEALSSILDIKSDISTSKKSITEKISDANKTQAKSLVDFQYQLAETMQSFDSNIKAIEKKNLVFAVVTWGIVIAVGVVLYFMK